MCDLSTIIVKHLAILNLNSGMGWEELHLSTSMIQNWKIDMGMGQPLNRSKSSIDLQCEKNQNMQIIISLKGQSFC